MTAACYDRYRPQDDDRVWPRGFYVKTDDLWRKDGWSDPIYFDVVGFDQDVSACSSSPVCRSVGLMVLN